MKNLACALVMVISAAMAMGKETVYEGTWVTTNRKLDGTMTCVVTDLGKNQWRGHFYGVWEGVEFSYTVGFSGTPEKLHGTAVIQGADYEWTGSISQGAGGRFKGSFGGNRYVGGFDLTQKIK